ncbi:hypothetical protein NpPPO83_00007672 [Neofusicoccum parvum]|uniref:Uncharacterized protein n=1 Tax=Neofusicoccum parvum TaxID=310453 RepID=A0ACB5SA05_9PEZI|nr:hypothetical protein NpPPO83_00007672 [Neofusicoccum parvum]
MPSRGPRGRERREERAVKAQIKESLMRFAGPWQGRPGRLDIRRTFRRRSRRGGEFGYSLVLLAPGAARRDQAVLARSSRRILPVDALRNLLERQSQHAYGQYGDSYYDQRGYYDQDGQGRAGYQDEYYNDQYQAGFAA